MLKALLQFEKKIGVIFKNKNLLRQAFVHRSYLNENPGFELDHNERLEFLGDAVLELVATEYLFYSYDNPEGELTNWRSALVKGVMLASVATQLGIDHLLHLSRGESRSTGKARQIILANALEALIGAVYLDRGYRVTAKFIKKYILAHTEEIISGGNYIDAKSQFQELYQEQMKITPRYKVLSETGPDHDKIFEIGVYVDDKCLGRGVGSSKQTAEQAAAENALQKMKQD